MNDGHINASMDIDNASLDVTFGEVYEIDKGMPAAIIANLYSSQSTYSPGDYVIYRSRLYKCLVAIETPEEFDSEKWELVKVAEELKEKADKSTTYTKTETNALLDEKADVNNVYTKTETDAFLDEKANSDNVYTKAEADVLLDEKADRQSTLAALSTLSDAIDTKADAAGTVAALALKADKTYVDIELDKKADKSSTYTKTEVDTALASKAAADSVYTKLETDEVVVNATEGKADTTYVNTELDKKADKTDTYTKSQVDTALNGKADKDTTYTKTQVDSEISRLDGKIDTKANASDVYTKSQADTLLNGKANASDVYTKQTTDALLNDKADVSDLPDMSQYYDKREVDYLLDDKANSDDVYGKAYIDTALSGKANVGTSYTKSEEDALLANKADKSDTYTKAQVDDIVYNILPDDTASGSVANFDTSLELPLKSLEVDVNAVQVSGTPTPESPLPIGGWSEITLKHSKKNFVDNSHISDENFWENISYDTYIFPLDLPKNATLTISGQHTVPSGLLPYVYLHEKQPDGTWTSIMNFWQAQQNLLPRSFITKDTEYRLWTYNAVASINTIDWLQIEAGTTASNYEQYSEPITEVINLGGTYYGGHFTQDKDGHRQFVATHGIIDLGEPNWHYSVNDNWFQIAHAHKYPTSNNLCSCYPVVYSLVNLADKTIAVATGYLAIKDTSFGSDVNAFKTAMTGQKLVYELATPIVIDLPDGEPIITINGTNNIYADTGDTSVVFKDSVNGYIEKKIASVQALILNG